MDRPGIDDYPVGARLYATRSTGVCEAGEPGLVVEAYELGGRPGRTIAFRGGGYDGFSPEDLAAICVPEGTVDPEAALYRFTNVGALSRDLAAGKLSFGVFAPYAAWLSAWEAQSIEARVPDPSASARKPAL